MAQTVGSQLHAAGLAGAIHTATDAGRRELAQLVAEKYMLIAGGWSLRQPALE